MMGRIEHAKWILLDAPFNHTKPKPKPKPKLK